MDPAPPDARLSNYRLDRLLGAGGMGVVYLARDLVLDRAVAIKFITPDRAADASARRRLIREARAAAALDHPNICAVHDVIVEQDGRACIVMQYVEGETLADLLRRGPLDPRLALRLAADLASGLAAAHARGIVHRDLKPQNIIVTPERHAKLLDFGIARQGELTSASDDLTTTSLTTPGLIIGTPAYMSPEQAQQLPLDGRTDLFSLGAVLFECLTGQRAFQGGTPLQLAAQVLQHQPPPVSSLRPGLSDQHDELVRRLLAKHPDDRFRSAEELLGALRVLVPDTGRQQVSPIPRPPRSGSPLALLGLRPFRPGRAAIATVVLLIGLAGLLSSRDRWGWRAPSRPPGPTTVIGILPFTNDSMDTQNDPVAAGLPDALATRLGSVGSLRVLPLKEIRDAIRERRESGQEDRDAAAVARDVGADFVIDGAVVRNGGTLTVTADLVGPDGSRQSAGRYAAVDRGLELHRRVADGLSTALARSGTAATGTSGTVTPTENADAFAEYSQGRGFLERPDVPRNLDHAIRLFQGAIAKDPRFGLAYAGLADAYWAQFVETNDAEWTTKAVAANLEALKIDPMQAEVRMSLAVMYSGQGRHAEAVDELSKVMRLQPHNDNAHRLLSGIHMARTEWNDAVEAARQAVALRPSYWRNHSQLGLAHFRAGRYEDAAAAYQRVVELQPDSARGYQSLGTTLQAAGKNDEALEKYDKALSIRPSARTYSNVGTLHFWRGHHQKAADAYEKALGLAPNDPALHANLGDAYLKRGQRTLAIESYRRAVQQVQKLLTVSGNDPQHLSALALYKAKLGQHDGAADAITKSLAISPRDGQVLYAAVLVHALAGQHARACVLLADAVGNGASSEEIRHANELSTLKGCRAYDDVVDNVRQRRD
jgi:serine/threonine-protein kinase